MHVPSVRKTIQFVRRLSRDAVDLVLPGTCCLCHAEVSDYRNPDVACRDCQDEHAKWKKCVRCSAVLRHENALPREDCPWCHHLQLPFESITSVGNYEGPLGDAVLNAKTNRGVSTAWDLGQLLSNSLTNHWTTAPIVIDVPMHWTRRIRRGMSSAAILAQSLAARRGWKHRQLLTCRRRLAKQSELSFTARKKNVHGAFRVREQIPRDQPILLVDDVMTTGSTLTEIGRSLRKAGATAIHVAVVARSTGSYADV